MAVFWYRNKVTFLIKKKFTIALTTPDEVEKYAELIEKHIRGKN